MDLFFVIVCWSVGLSFNITPFHLRCGPLGCGFIHTWKRNLSLDLYLYLACLFSALISHSVCLFVSNCWSVFVLIGGALCFSEKYYIIFCAFAMHLFWDVLMWCALRWEITHQPSLFVISFLGCAHLAEDIWQYFCLIFYLFIV